MALIMQIYFGDPQVRVGVGSRGGENQDRRGEEALEETVGTEDELE